MIRDRFFGHQSVFDYGEDYGFGLLLREWQPRRCGRRERICEKILRHATNKLGRQIEAPPIPQMTGISLLDVWIGTRGAAT